MEHQLTYKVAFHRLSFISLWIILSIPLISIPLSSFAQPTSQHPQNPCRINQHLYTGGTGLQKIDITTHDYKWSVLKQVNTFEPVCANGQIFIGSRNGLYAIDSRHGKILWSVGSGTSLYSPIVVGDFLYVSSLDGWIKKLHRNTGKVVWQKKVKGWLYPPAVFNKLVVVGGKARTLFAFNIDNGNILWQKRLKQELVYRPVASRSNIIIVTTYGPEVIAIDISKKKILWTRKHISAPYTPAVGEHNIFYGDQDGMVYAVNLHNGKELWRRQLRGVIRSSPTLSRYYVNTVWIGTEAGQLAALNRNNGDILWKRQLNVPIVHSPFPFAKKVYFKADSQRLMFELFSLPKTIIKTVTFQ